MLRPNAALIVATILIAAAQATADEQVESFDGGEFTNPFFNHQIEFNDPCCFEILRRRSDNDWVMHLRPNTDLITFNLTPGERVESISVEMQDFEGGFRGNQPSSAIVVRGASGDFVALHTAGLGTIEVITADVNTPGQIDGEPLGEIISIHFQVANEGNSKVPGVGAMFDDITVVTSAVFAPGDLNCDRSINALDIEPFLVALFDPESYAGQYPDCDINLADINGDGRIDALDIEGFLGLLFP